MLMIGKCGMIPALLQRGFNHDLPATRSIFTIHNIAYQGNFPGDAMRLFGLDGSLFNGMHCEHFGRLNCLKAGIAFADRVTTVSKTYAQEICHPSFGYGLDGFISQNKFKVSGITNGIDAHIWNPETDALLPPQLHERVAEGQTGSKN